MKKWFAILPLSFCVGACLAQPAAPAKKGQATPSKSSATSEAAPVNFSMAMVESGRIDPRYLGMPVGEIAQRLEKMAFPKKGEFETTADFNARKSSALSTKLSGNAGIEDTLAFVVPVGSGATHLGNGMKFIFNADTSEVRLYALPKPASLNGIGGPDYKAHSTRIVGLDLFELDSNLDSKGTYQGSNAYGATVTVKEFARKIVGLASPLIPFLTFRRSYNYLVVPPAARFNLDAARAERELSNLKALILFKLEAPYLVYDFNYVKPTRDNPIDSSTSSKYLTGSVSAILFYSGLTGEILATAPDTFGKPGQKAEEVPVAN